MNNNLPPLIVVLGPTGSGKTSLSLKLAKKYNGEIISADSRQIYKDMNIGTDKIKITQEQKNKKTILTPISFQKIPHYMIDIINPDEKYSVANYKKDALKIINNILKRGKIPFLVGGTGLYIKALVDNLNIPQVKPDVILRKKLNAMDKKQLFSIFKKLDSRGAEKIDKDNKRRLVRAIEICKQTKQPFSEQNKKGKPLFNVLQIGIKIPREILYKKIDERIDEMIEKGLIDETKKLAQKYSFDLPAMSGIGYKEIGEYLSKEIILNEAIQKIKYRTHQYIRRQDTWFRKDKRIKWVKDYDQAEKIVRKFL
jgi:tRNA dimethylallyltransferase